MKRILIVAPFTQLPGEQGNNRGRFKRIAEMLAEKGYSVTVATSRFRELDRTFRKDEEVFASAPYRIVLLRELGYTRNISLRRVRSMASFTRSLKRFLKSETEPFDLVYSCVPGLDSALAAGRYARSGGIPFVIDVQDLWPEAMYAMILDIPVISRLMFLPIRIKADRVYAMADGIMAVSKTYMDAAAAKNKINRFRDYVFIGSDIDDSDTMPEETPFGSAGTIGTEGLIGSAGSMGSEGSIGSEGSGEEFRIAYIGSLGHSYDILTLLDGAKKALDRGIPARPVIIGSGPLEQEFKEYARIIESNALFTGWVDHATMRRYLSGSGAVINAIKKKAPQSITNKVGDYLASGKPMLNGSLNPELRELLAEYRFGMNYSPEDPESLASAIGDLYRLGEDARRELGRNGRRLAEEKFDRKATYPKIVAMVERLLEQGGKT